MMFEISSGSKYLPLQAKKYYRAVGHSSKEELIEYALEIASAKGLEMYTYFDSKVACVYLNEQAVCYYISFVEEDDVPPKQETERTKVDIKNSSVFVKSFLTLILILSSFFNYASPASAVYFDGNIEEDTVNYTGLAKARFNTPSGTTTIPGYLTRVTNSYYSDLAFTLENPRRLSESVTLNPSYTLNNSANKALIEAMLAYRIKYTVEQIREESGLSVNERQVDEATQLALWTHAATFQVDFQIDVNSISDPAVRTLASNIFTWATKQVTNAGQASLTEYIFPTYQPKIDSSNAKMSREGDTVYYGPYVVQAQQKVRFSYTVLGGVIVDTSKKKVDSVITGQQFYIQFPVSYNGNKDITLSGVQLKYTLQGNTNRVWLHREPSNASVKFSVGGTTGSNGLIVVETVDSITGKPVPGVTVEISTSSPQDTVVTTDQGKVEYPTHPGKYTLQFNVPTGYLTPNPVEVQVAFAGDIQQIKVPLEWSQAILNFYAVDAKSLAPSGDSEAFIYDSTGKAVKRIAISKGSVKGIILPEGEYTIVQYKTSDNYALNAGVKFVAQAGKSIDVSIPQDPNVMPTTISVKGATLNDSWVYTVSDYNRVLFKMSSNNSLELPLPNGSYSVKAEKSDGTRTAGPKSFSTTLNGETKVEIDTIKGDKTVTFNITDTVVEEAIPDVVLGLFDENHNLLDYKTANSQGQVTFENVVGYRIYYVNVLAAPQDVSGYSAVGNRFLGQDSTHQLKLYSLAEIKTVTEVDTIYRVPNITYTGPSYTYPQ